jgi:carboxylate-amine ligase
MASSPTSSATPAGASASPTAAELRAAFSRPEPLTIGLEEELMLLDPETLDLTPKATEVLAAAGGDPRFKLELPAAQLEIVTTPERTAPSAVAQLAAGRRHLAAAAAGVATLATAGAHPFAAADGTLNEGERYDGIRAEYASIARRQLVFGLQVHVAIGDADAALAVYNALRAYVPELAALAACAPFHAGADTGLASVRPTISGMLPRQGVPPALESWEAFAAALRWGAAAGRVREPRLWWWEVRPHAAFGTLEVRAPDAQASIEDAGAVASVVHALVAWLVERHAAGDALPVAESWRIAENRWSACRYGVEGELADLETGELAPTRARLHALLDDLGPAGERLGCADGLARARAMADEGGAARHRAVAAQRGLRGLAAWLAEAYAPTSGSVGRPGG